MRWYCVTRQQLCVTCLSSDSCPQELESCRDQCVSLYRAGSLFCRVLGPLQNRTLELIQQKRFLSQQVKAMGGVYDDVADLAAAVTCTYTTTRKHNRGLQPGVFVCENSAAIAISYHHYHC